MIHQLKDKFLKEMAELFPQFFLNPLEIEQEYEIVSTKLDKELIVRKRDSDFVTKLKIGRRVFLFHFEFISKYRRADVRRANGYNGALSLKYKKDVVTILFVLKPPSRKPKNLGHYDVAPFGQTMNAHRLAVVKLWELRDDILAGKKEYLGFVPILPEISEVVNIDLLKKQRELLTKVQDPALQAILRFYTVAFAQSYFSQEQIETHLKESEKMIEHWEQVPIYGERIKQRVREAEDAGEKRGEIVALQKIILDLLEIRFGYANGKITKQINSINKPQKLREFYRLLLKTESLDKAREILSLLTA
jgi:hypothetical protein